MAQSFFTRAFFEHEAYVDHVCGQCSPIEQSRQVATCSSISSPDGPRVAFSYAFWGCILPGSEERPELVPEVWARAYHPSRGAGSSFAGLGVLYVSPTRSLPKVCRLPTLPGLWGNSGALTAETTNIMATISYSCHGGTLLYAYLTQTLGDVGVMICREPDP